MFYPAELLPFLREYSSLSDWIRTHGGRARSSTHISPSGIPFARAQYQTPSGSVVSTAGSTPDEAEFRLLLALQQMEAEEKMPAQSDYD